MDNFNESNEEEILKIANKYYREPRKFISLILEKIKGTNQNQSQIFFSIGTVLRKIPKYCFLAIDCFKEAIILSGDNTNNAFLINCYTNIGMIYGKLGKHIKALRNFHHCLRISNKINHKRSITQSSVKIGIGYYNIERYKVASEYLERSLKLINKLDDNSLNFLCSDCNRFLGLINKHHGNYQRALHFQKKALNINIKLNNRFEEANTYLNLGSIYYDIGNQTENILFQKMALKIFKEISNKKEQASCYNNLGNAFMNLEKPLKSLYNHKKALDIMKALGDKKGLANSYNNIGVLKLKLEKYHDVIYYNTESLKIYREIGSKSGEAKSLGCISIANIELKEINKAENNLIKALELFNEIGLIDGIISSRLNQNCLRAV
jgi:tetratricopeptide (TPR) repeat protein